jgi:2-polyprenyl-3-methyl-5-hydroxy-6-metoxy-1,4-benzoquinol methylase
MNTQCVVCAGVLTPWVQKLDRQISRCSICGHIAVPAGLVRNADGGSIYEGNDSVLNAYGNREYYLDAGSHRAALAKSRFVRRYAPANGTLLDVGAGYGHFLAAASNNFSAVGIELNCSAVEWGRRTLHVRSHVGSVYAIPAELGPDFDVITAWDVIEHLEDPRGAVRGCRDRLAIGGWLFLSTPDAGAMVARLLGSHWYYLDPLQHINLFSRTNLRRVLEEEGFAVKATTSFGHTYRVSYVLNRLAYLAGEGRVSASLRRFERALPGFARSLHLTLKLFDVMGIAAVRAR